MFSSHESEIVFLQNSGFKYDLPFSFLSPCTNIILYLDNIILFGFVVVVLLARHAAVVNKYEMKRKQRSELCAPPNIFLNILYFLWQFPCNLIWSTSIPLLTTSQFSFYIRGKVVLIVS